MEWIPKPRADRCSEGELVETVWVARLVKKEEAGVVAEISRPERPTYIPLPVCNGRDEQNDDPNEVVQGKDSERPPNVEVSISVDLVLAVIKNPGDEKAGQDEENIDTRPSPTEHKCVTSPVMLEEHHDDRDCS